MLDFNTPLKAFPSRIFGTDFEMIKEKRRSVLILQNYSVEMMEKIAGNEK